MPPKRRNPQGKDPAGTAPGTFEIDPTDTRPLFMISVAAQLAGVHPQTLRIYERKGLIDPGRSVGNTRLYSYADIAKLARIQALTTQLGLNLAGVERVLEMESALAKLQDELDELKAQLQVANRELTQKLAQVHRSYKRELVPVPKGGTQVVLASLFKKPR